MPQKNETTIMIASFLITAGILGGGYWWFTRPSGGDLRQLFSGNSIPPQNQPITSGNPLSPPPAPTNSASFKSPTTVPPGTTVTIDGSTSMVLLNQALKNGFEQQFPGTQVLTDAKGTNNGLQALLRGGIDIAAISRPLTANEKAQGLVAIPLAKDAIAIVVGIQNSFRQGLTEAQIVEIFQGKVTDWSTLRRSPGTIRVINRPSVSGTRQTFEQLVLNGGNFGNTPNITTMPKDATTPILQALGTDGISYATYAQVANQQTVRTVAINGQTPEAADYPYQRSLYYVYKQPPSEAVQAFLGYAVSPTGQQIISNAQ